MHQKLEVTNNFIIISEDDLSRQFVYIKLQATLPLVSQDGNILETLEESRKNVSLFKEHFYQLFTYIFIYNCVHTCHL